jgi:hypothetical protein
MSGAVWWASQAVMRQYEGFAYAGLGMLLLAASTATAWVDWVRVSWRRHIVIALALAVLLALALSNHVFVGDWEVLSFNLPSAVLTALGTIRSSGRLVWPIGYALVAGTLILALRKRARPAGTLVVIACTILQLIDVEPLRASIARSIRDPAPLVLDQSTVLPLIKEADAVMVFPSFSCVMRLGKPYPEMRALWHVNMELQLMAARSDTPINSVYTGRAIIDCKSEDTARLGSLKPGLLYIYLNNILPTQDGAATLPCYAEQLFSYCFRRAEAGDTNGVGARIGR